MTKLNDKQEAILASVAREYVAYQEGIHELEVWLAQEKRVRKAPVLDAIDAATEAGIPVRRIHLAMGLDQVSKLQRFIQDDRPASVGEMLAQRRARPSSSSGFTSPAGSATLPQSVPFTVTVDPAKKNGYNAIIRDSKGTEYSTSILQREDEGDTLIYPGDYSESPDAEAITAYFHKNYKNVKEFA